MAANTPRKSAKQLPKKRAARRTPATGGPPARARQKPGNPGFSGYDYQIEVTIWAALDLMLAKAVTEAVAIEPASDEDLEASVKDPSSVSLGLQTQATDFDLFLQAKSRSGSPWSTPDIADILLGEKAADPSTGRKRSRPLQMLTEDARRRYVFVTNEGSVGSLRPHEGTHLLDFPDVDELPPHAREGYDATEQASLGRRILLLTNITNEVLSARIRRLLSAHGHVPISTQDDCLRDLRDEVRARIRGAYGGRWTRAELISVLVRHGGSLAPTRDMDRYVRPRSFDVIKDRLDKSHAVIIAGPSGTGKTLTGEILVFDLRRGDLAFEVVGGELGPGAVRGRLTVNHPILVHLHDPWGSNRLAPGADSWSDELPKLLDRASPNRKFVITSRSDVLQSAGKELVKTLHPYIVSLDIDDYGPNRLAEIYDRLAQDLSDEARHLAMHHREQALKTLARPFEINRFMVAISQEDRVRPRKIAEILADSQIEAISGVIARQLSQLGPAGAEAAAIIWALLSAREVVAREIFIQLGRRLREADPSLRPDVDGLIDFLVAGQNLRPDGIALAFYHPRVEDGLRMAFMHHARDAEPVLAKVVDILVDWDKSGEDWGVETGLNVLRTVAKVDGLELKLVDATTQRIDHYLDALVLSSDKGSDFGRALRDLVRFGSDDHLPARLARLLLEGGPKSDRQTMFRYWRAPSLSDEEVSAFRADGRTHPIVERFISEVLPFSRQDYDLELVPLLARIASDLQQAFWKAFALIEGPGGQSGNINAIVAGALQAPLPDYDRVIERFGQSEAKATVWLKDTAERRYAAEEHATDAGEASYLMDEPEDEFSNASRGMKAVVGYRRTREGVTWIATSPHRGLLFYALGELLVFESTKPEPDELRFLLMHAEGWARDQAWRAAKLHWDASLNDLLIDELARSDIDSTSRRGELIRIAAALGDVVPSLVAAAAKTSFARRLGLICDLFGAHRAARSDGDSPHAAGHSPIARLIETFTESEQELAQALFDFLASNDGPPPALSDDSRKLLAATLPQASNDCSGPLTCLAACAGLNIDAAAIRLLSTDDARDGELALRALMIAKSDELEALLEKALEHRRYPVRRLALRLLSANATQDRRQRLILTAKDWSADVRLEFAELMQSHRWPDAIDALTELLRDIRNFADRPLGSSWSRFAVARAAACALSEYETLPRSTLEALLRAAQDDSDDPFVACAAMDALAARNDPRIVPIMIAALARPGLEGAIAHRPFAQSAAWALYDRALARHSDMLVPDVARAAQHDVSTIAGPVLVAFGIHPGDACQSAQNFDP